MTGLVWWRLNLAEKSRHPDVDDDDCIWIVHVVSSLGVENVILFFLRPQVLPVLPVS